MITSRLGINYYLRHLVIGQIKNFLGGNWKGFAASNCNGFPSLISPFISGRESQNESFPRTHNLGERTRQVWQDNNRRVRTHESDSRVAARRLGRIIQGIFSAQSGAGIREAVWKWSGEIWYQGLFRPFLKTFVAPFRPPPTDCPWVSEDASTLTNNSR